MVDKINPKITQQVSEHTKIHWYKFYINDYLRDTGHLNHAQHGAYRLLIDQCFLARGNLPAEKRAVYRLVSAIDMDEQKNVDGLLAEFFHLTGKGYTHKRVTSDIAYMEKMRRASQENGALGGRPKKDGEPKNNPAGNPAGNLDVTQHITQTITQKEPESVINNHTISNQESGVKQPESQQTEEEQLLVEKKPSTARKTADRFDEFWKAYPKKAAKQDCLKVWARQNLDALAEQIIDDVTIRTSNHKPWVDGYVLNPLTYLRGARWTDAIETIQEHRNDPDKKRRNGYALTPAERVRANYPEAFRDAEDDSSIIEVSASHGPSVG
jgi:uncharacterized protein YdaU (DUF1376 family)